MSFKENVVIITGASSGIGRELALQLAREGAWLALAARDEKRLREIAKQCQKLGGRALVVPTDVADEDQCQQLVEKTIAEYGRVDTLINNAGFGIRGKFEEWTSLTNFRRLTEVNYFGAVYCTYYALPYLKKTKGRIVGVSSILGKFAMQRNTAYCGSKFAMAGFFDSLRLELMGSGVSVTMIYPGYVVTEFALRMVKTDGSLAGEDARKFYLKPMMTAKRCARIIIAAAGKRKRQVVLTFYGVLGVWLNFLFPSLLGPILNWVSLWNKNRMEGR